MSPRSLAARVLCGFLAAWLCACAREPVAAPPASASDARNMARAAELAPDLYGRSLQARREARASSNGARENASARAELWLQAAVVEAERIDAQRAAAAAEARTLAAESRRIAALHEREQLERDQVLVEAGRLAHTRAEHMLAGGALAEAARRGDDAALTEATSFALERASLLLASARALGLAEPGAATPPVRLDALAARLDALAAQADSRPRLRASLALLEALERALGEARLARPGPSAQERASLRADAAERGLALDLQPNRARLTFDARAFAPGRADASAEGVLALANLAALLRLHPRGTLELEPGSSALAARRAGTLATRLRAMPTNVHIVPVPAEPPSTDAGADTVTLWLLAYGTAAAPEPRAITTP